MQTQEVKTKHGAKRWGSQMWVSHLELFCLLWGDLALLGSLSLDAERDDERPLLHELLRCRRFGLVFSSFFLPDACGWRPGDADVLWWWAWPRVERWCRLEEWPPFALEQHRKYQIKTLNSLQGWESWEFKRWRCFCSAVVKIHKNMNTKNQSFSVSPDNTLDCNNWDKLWNKTCHSHGNHNKGPSANVSNQLLITSYDSFSPAVTNIHWSLPHCNKVKCFSRSLTCSRVLLTNINTAAVWWLCDQ